MPIYNAPLKKVDQKETRRYAGLAIADFDENFIIDACDEIVYSATPRGIWNMYNYDNIHGIVLADKDFQITGSKILNHLSHCQKVIIMAVTIGEVIEKSIEMAFNNGTYSHGLLLDAAATTAVEQIADALEKNIDPKANALGYKRIWRFSPGYGDWSITCQPQILKLANAEKIGIHCTSSMMLTPRKSVTAIIGLVPQTDPFSPEKPSCQNCSQKNCPSRKVTNKNF
ncbi:vitamin B12 dependent-methionine synthase activation domain-containing protein [Pectinatus sottacetonis]|uniref:vitamin B12 dependent-methionine synthase activation domain-containing protein n=1 Tax=Pectinatus sottacetonis TaxID=1002795 RepID=UPI0018C60519|nr:vitamin B12 dependent-methionine synthase activation domain-containing protein [Pectinatus sottacetonis]